MASRGVESLVSDFADDTTNPSTDANGSPALSAARTAIDDGLKIARGCGFGLYHIDLQLELARLRLLQGNPSEALAALRTALDETRPKNAETGALSHHTRRLRKLVGLAALGPPYHLAIH
ncbi:MAG: hypothetical protein ACKVII_06825 [Planctomycetales bacterium]